MVFPNSSITPRPSPLAIAAIPRVPGQVANTPVASFIPNIVSPFSFLEFEIISTGTKCSHSSAFAFN